LSKPCASTGKKEKGDDLGYINKIIIPFWDFLSQ